MGGERKGCNGGDSMGVCEFWIALAYQKIKLKMSLWLYLENCRFNLFSTRVPKYELKINKIFNWLLLYLIQMQVFNLEVENYTFLIPKLQEIRAKNNLKPLAFAKCFYASAADELIILENMKAQNFEVILKKPERKLWPINFLFSLNFYFWK